MCFVYLAGQQGNITTVHPSKIKNDLVKQYDEVAELELAGRFLRITCLSETQQTRLLGYKILAGCQSSPCNLVIGYYEDQSTFNKVIIFNIPLDITSDELKECSVAVSAFRIMKRELGDLQPKTSVGLSCELGADLPPSHPH